MFVSAVTIYAQHSHIIVIRDSETGKPIENALVTISGNKSGNLTDSNGIAKIDISKRSNKVRVSMMGYDPQSLTISADNDSTVINLKLVGIALDEVEVSKKREHYSKRNNPAVELMEMVREHSVDSDPENYDYLNYDVYEKISLALTRDKVIKNKNQYGNLSFLNEYVDSSVFPDIPILNISLKEKIASRFFRRSPRTKKEYVDGIRRIGVDDIIDQASMQILLDDLLNEIDIYSNDIAVLRNRFVSPLSRIGADFYKYYITDTVIVDGFECTELSFVPRVAETYGFTGKMYVINDSTYFINKIGLSLPQHININFIEKFNLIQTFARDSLGRRKLLNDDLAVIFSVIPGTQGIYARRNSLYYNYNNRPTDNTAIFSTLAPTTTSPTALQNGKDYWIENRPIPLSDAEGKLEDMIDRLRSNKTYHIMETALKIIVNGYIPTAFPDNRSKFDIGPWNTLISGNDIEGVRLRLGGITTSALNQRWFANAYIAYGTKDRKAKYGAEIEYSFHDKQNHAKEFPINSLSISNEYDVDKIGQHYLFTSADNFVLSLTRIRNQLMTYKNTTKLQYTLELENNFSIAASIERVRQHEGPYLPFITCTGVHNKYFDISSFTLQLRYAPGEKFYQAKRERIPISRDTPIFTLTHRYGPDGVLGNTFGVNKTDVSIQKRFWLSAFGYLDMIVKGGHIWNRVPYPLLLMPNSNLSYTIQPESFSMMNPMEFINDTDVSLFLTYWANGTILNRIPLIKKLKLREVFSFRGYWGHLSSRNIPSTDNNLYLFPADATATPMHGKPYMEVSAGLDNIFKLFRVDYVWRLNYLDLPGISRGGFRVALHLAL